MWAKLFGIIPFSSGTDLTNLMRAVCQKKFEKLDRDQVLRQVSLVHLTSIAGLLV